VSLFDLIKVAPGALPLAEIVHRASDLCLLAFPVSLLSLVILVGVSLWLKHPLPAAVGCVMAVASHCSYRLAAKLKPDSVQIGTLPTFRELCKLLASHSQPDSASEPA
jgi:hypothetical protein